MAAPVYLTKGELRSKLLIRLGYGGLGAAAGAFVPMADDLLETAQEEIFELLPTKDRIRTWDFTTGAGQKWYDIPAECDYTKILDFNALDGTEWHPVQEGIGPQHDSVYSDTTDIPRRYDIRYNVATSQAQIEIWPYQEGGDAFRIEGLMTPTAFTADGHRAVVDSRLLLLHAIAFGKAHLKRHDAADAMKAWERRLGLLKAAQHGTVKYVRENPARRGDRMVRSKPRVV